MKRVEKFLKTKSSANFNYPDTAKQKFASTYESHLSTEELIQKHLYTSPYMNPNDPVLHIRWANSSHGRTSYSLVHMALDPYFIGENKAPSFLPDFESVLTECRSQVIGALAEGGADFNCRPNAYTEIFRGKEYVNPSLQQGSDFPYIGLHPLAAARFSSSHFFSTTELAAYALFYGADTSNIFHLWNGSRDFSEDRNKFMDELFEKAFNHRLEGKIATEKMYFAPSVREKLLTIKENRIRELTDQIKTETARRVLTDEEHVDLDEEVIDMLCSMDNAYKTNEDREKAIQKLSVELERVQQLTF